MNAPDAVSLIRSHLQRMDALYGGSVFDEWAVVVLAENGPVLFAYEGGRREAFMKTLPADVRGLRAAMVQRQHSTGDFEFAVDSEGSHIDAFMRLGVDSFLLCNHTDRSMRVIRTGENWRKAQVAWFDLGQALATSPLVV